jgi:hypothetical protein
MEQQVNKGKERNDYYRKNKTEKERTGKTEKA